MAGSELLWVTKEAYRKAFQGRPPSLQKEGDFGCSYGTGVDDNSIVGELYKGTVSFLDEKTYVKNQFFGIVDADRVGPQADNILGAKSEGIFGLGSSALGDRTIINDVNGKEIRERLPTLLENLKYQHRIPENIVGITIGLPSEGLQYSYEKGILLGELHFGGPKAGAYDEATMMEIPTVKEGNLAADYAVNLALKCETDTIMDKCQGIIDSGSTDIFLPKDVIAEYINKVNHDANKKLEVVKRDKDGLYYIEKKNFKYLKDIEFLFSRGAGKHKASFKLPPAAQVHPPAFQENFPNDEYLGLTIADMPEAKKMRFILGAPWSKFNLIYV